MNIKLDINEIDKKRIKELVDNYWLGLGDITKYNISHPLLSKNKDPLYLDNPTFLYLDYFTNLDYLEATTRLFLNVQLAPFQAVILREFWRRPFPMFIATRGGSKSFLLAVYALLRAFLTQGSKTVIAGSVFRQSKLVFDNCLRIWNNAPLLRSCCESFGGRQGPYSTTDRVGLIIGESRITGLPVGATGQTVRGERANYLLMDEFSTHNPDIYETVLSGFASVSHNPMDNIVREGRRDALMELGLWNKELEAEYNDRPHNQTVLSGTAYYEFNHFYDYYTRYKRIIYSRGDKDKLLTFGIELPEGISWRDFSIIRLPYKLLPKGYLDEKHVARGKVTMHKANFGMEFSCVFSVDSEGFFKRSLIESCVTKTPIRLPSGNIQFHPMLKGDPNKEYVFSIDPASERDNFAVVVMELNPDHRRVVYVWTINRRLHLERYKSDNMLESDFYAYCARKIRNLMKVFNCKQIGLDAQGGGRAVAEALHDKNKLEVGEHMIWPIVKMDKPEATDAFPGLHILNMIEFSDYKWVYNANHNLKMDFENKTLLFPYFDDLSETLAMEDDKRIGRPDYDNMANLIAEVEELKDELAIITHTQTPNGRERWDTPEGIITTSKKKSSTQRKDRYTALLIANACARELQMPVMEIQYKAHGGFVGSVPTDNHGPMFVGPDWFVKAMDGVY